MAATHFSGPVYAKGQELTANPKQAAIASITTDMSNDPNDNELKTKVNAILAALRAANIIAS